MEAIILAGGFGTRLSHIVTDVPKPMAIVNRRPFLEYILNYLIDNGIKHIILAVGYKGKIIQNYFGDNYKNVSITYSNEDTPLGTGGAIKKALGYCNKDNVFIVNGDTYYDVNLNLMERFHNTRKSDLTIAVKIMHDFDRYGSVMIKNDMIMEFEEKKKTVSGRINGGTYLINKSILNKIEDESFSFEKLILESGFVDIYAFENDGYFIDIGVPEDYYRAQDDFLNM